jgi:hemerythrin
MERFPWKDEYSVHIAKIDEQHQKLLFVVNQLHAGMGAGQSKDVQRKIFAGLLDYALHHFKTEEELMLEHDFPGYDEHKMEHDAFRKKLIQFLDAFLDANEDVSKIMVQYLDSWLYTHVFLTDKQYSAFLNERGIF